MARRSAVSIIFLSFVIAGLVPAIPLRYAHCSPKRHRRVKPGDDEWRGPTMPRLADRVAIVTGGAKGIGRHYAQALAAEGARVMIADIADGNEVAGEIALAHGLDAVASVICNVSDEAQVKDLVARTIERFGQIDILVNNAALYATLTPRNFDEWDVELWDRVMAINVRGSYLMVRHVAPHMMARRRGKIINIASGA